MAERSRAAPSAQFSITQATSSAGSSKRHLKSVSMEDLFNYLYGYTPIRLVDPKQLHRETLKSTPLENGKTKGLNYCEVCNEMHDGECPMHGPLHSLRKLVTAGQSSSLLENGSVLKFPDEVCLCTSSIPCMRYGVCARKRIPAGTWIGPYEGKLMRPEDIGSDTETEYMWEVFHDGQVSHYLDGREEANASWMRFVRCARHKKEQNMVVFQYHGCVYYRTVRDILAGQELLVWYDARYSQFMGVPVALSDSGSRGVQPPRDLVAQRTRDRPDTRDEPAAKRHQSEHAPAQRGRPPLRRSQELEATTPLTKTESGTEEQREPDRRTMSTRGRPSYSKYSTRNSTSRAVDMADDFTWRCNLCFKAFAVREQLEEHRCNGMGIAKNLVCPHCTQSFSHPVEFRTHVESHTNARPFRCGYCANAFASATLLNQHVRVHLTEAGLGKLGTRHEQRVSHEFQF